MTPLQNSLRCSLTGRLGKIAGWGFAAAAVAFGAPTAQADDSPLEFFERRIRPVLVEHCYACHSDQAETAEGGLRVDSSARLLRGGDSGAAIEPRDPEQSLLIAAISYSGEVAEMPPEGKLPERVIEDFRQWIATGAPLPDADPDSPQETPQLAADIAAGRDLWSLQPLRSVTPPPSARADWSRTAIDPFVLAKLQEHDLEPAEPADPRMLIRRVYLDLVGYPPTYDEVVAFSRGDVAYETVVERLLASPDYGERWARHWLDVARYAEDNPTSEKTCPPPRYPFAYRDWVIGALNRDLPYDQFVRRQLAADLMDLPPEEVAATGFLGLSPVYHKETKLSKEVIATILADEWDERLDTVTRGLLGLTVACARCHDHKFDPITTEDYYALAGVIANTQLVEWPLVETDPEVAERLTATREAMIDAELRISNARNLRRAAEINGESTEPFERDEAKYRAELERLESIELFEGPTANAVRDAMTVINAEDPTWTLVQFRAGESRDLPVFIRGNPNNPGELVPRRFLEVFSAPGTQPEPFRGGSGRLQMADAIFNDASALAARVIVNRVWGWHFGTPLVRTSSNFGTLGELPSHPDLLENLATRLVENGWSLKWLHREILLSATYRQSSVATRESIDAAARIDPENRLLWQMPRRRLEPEAWRDCVLKVTGGFERQPGGPSSDLDVVENRRRSIYGTISRQKPADLLRLFDFPDAKRHTDTRTWTTTPLQQLYLLNSPAVREQAKRLLAAAEVSGEEEAEQTSAAVIGALFHTALQRDPTEREQRAALQLILDEQGALRTDRLELLAHSLLASNEFLFVD